jgi:uncharacterized protein YndB with AHSA1/START domain
MMQLDGCTPRYDADPQIATVWLRMSERVARRIEVPAPPEVVWLALTVPEQLRGWFGADVILDPRPGGDVHATWPDGGRSVGWVEAAEEPRRLAFRWRRIDGVGFTARVGGATRVEFVLAPSAGGTTVSVTEGPVELSSAVSGR